MTALPVDSLVSDLALSFKDVGKTYRIYGSVRQAVADRLGLFVLRFWRPRPRFSEFEALRNVTLSVKRGERVGIIGRNGAGKTTLLKLLSRNFAPSNGSVDVFGSVQAIMKTGLGFHADSTGRENANYALLYNGLGQREIEAAIAEVEEFTELGGFFDRPISTYSQGMVARLQFAVATAVHPDIVIIDEVLGAGDTYFSNKSAARMRKLANSGATLLIVSHALELIHEFCDRVIWMDRGSVVADGAPDEVIARYQKSIDELVGADGSVEAAAETVPTSGASQDLASRRYLAKAISAQELVDPGYELETRVTLPDGTIAYRWGSAPTLKVVDLSSPNGRRGYAVVSVGETFSLTISTECQAVGHYRVFHAIMVYAVDGTRVAVIESPVDEFEGSAGYVRQATMELPALLGSGDYLLSIGVFDAGKAGQPSHGNRMDYLSRSFQLKIAETNDGDPPVLHGVAPWVLGDAEHPVLPVIDGRI